MCLVEGVYGPSCFPRHRGSPFDQLSCSTRSSTPFQYPAFPPLFPTVPGDTLLGLLSQQGLLPQGTLRCTVCLAGFPSAWLLEQHTALQHSGHSSVSVPRAPAAEPTEDKPFRCEQCGQSYRYRSAFLKHREQNHRARLPADKLFTCDVCGMQFRYLKSFKKHRLNHALERLHNPFNRPSSAASDSHRSETSERSEAVSTSARSATDEVTSTNETEEPAPETTQTQSSATAAPEQDDTVDSIALALGKNEASLLGLLRLGSDDRQRERRSFACPFCGKCVRSKENLKLHVRKHTGERPFACLFCGRAFGGKSDLTRHLRIHTGERPYHCEMCGKCFARADYLSKHLTTHIHHSHHQR